MSETDSTIPVGFRQIPGFPRYAIDENGTVLSVCKMGNVANQTHPWSAAIQKKPAPKGLGHLCVHLRHDNRRRSFHVHDLVLIMFVGPCPDGMECRHLDGNPANNHVSNLKWGTRSENEQDKVLHGKSCRGEKHGSAKLTSADVLEIRRRAANGERQLNIAKDFHVKQQAISNIVIRRAWKHI